MAKVEMLFARLTVGDSKVCDDCKALEGSPEMTRAEWESSGLLPRVAPTECDGSCRCFLVPTSKDDIQAAADELIEQAVDEAMSGIKVDLTTGRTILLKDFERYDFMLTAQYSAIAGLESKIVEWKTNNDGAKLPKEYFELTDLSEMIDWLEKN